MAQDVIIRCDWRLEKGRSKGEPCGQIASTGHPTKFMIDEQYYQADLCDEHQEELRRMLEPVIAISQPYSPKYGGSVRKVLKSRGGKTFTTRDVRAWLMEQGREVSHTGRLPESLIEEYKNAHANSRMSA